MTGPEHYAEAERLLDGFGQEIEVEPGALPAVMAHMQAAMTRAQVHATLALAATQAMGRYPEMPIAEAKAWLDALGEHPEVTS